MNNCLGMRIVLTQINLISPNLQGYSCLRPVAGIFFDFSFTVKAAPHECVIRTGQP